MFDYLCRQSSVSLSTRQALMPNHTRGPKLGVKEGYLEKRVPETQKQRVSAGAV